MFVQVTAKNVWGVFMRHSVVCFWQRNVDKTPCIAGTTRAEDIAFVETLQYT